MFAVINIRKAPGMTSHDVVARLRRIYGLKKIGHLGTLDPLAEGVLPVCLGQATRLIEYFPTGKSYRAEITLGRTTTTLDAEGDTVTEADCTRLDLSPEKLDAVLSNFRGIIQQTVPLYSAVHVKGKKLYELARQGKTADLPSREVTIHRLELLEVDDTHPAAPRLVLDIACSSGTYIRAIARDVGDALGVGAYLSHLMRTGHGQFDLEGSVTLDTLQEATDPSVYLQEPIQFLELPRFPIDAEGAKLLGYGIKVDPQANAGGVAVKMKPNALYLVMHQERPVGVVSFESGLLKPVKIFHLD